jgi:hypothetical protein
MTDEAARELILNLRAMKFGMCDEAAHLIESLLADAQMRELNLRERDHLIVTQLREIERLRKALRTDSGPSCPWCIRGRVVRGK